MTELRRVLVQLSAVVVLSCFVSVPVYVLRTSLCVVFCCVVLPFFFHVIDFWFVNKIEVPGALLLLRLNAQSIEFG